VVSICYLALKSNFEVRRLADHKAIEGGRGARFSIQYFAAGPRVVL